jgi:hypothetical protein
MTMRDELPTVEIDDDGRAVRFGRWHAPISIRRDFDIRAGKELGIIVEVGGGACDGPYLRVLLLPPGGELSSEQAEEIQGRIAADVAKLAERFMADLVDVVAARVAQERLCLEGR